MDPKTGAILAVASVPAYDAEDYAAIAADDMDRLGNRVFWDQYEPGSVMKIFTATAALDLGLVTPSTVIQDQKKLEFWKYTVRNADHKSEGALKVKDVIALSRNVATAKLARMLAPNSTQKAAHRLYDLWQKVGMTDKTGVDVAYEADGVWYDPENCPVVTRGPGQPRLRPGRVGDPAAAGPRHLHHRQRRLPGAAAPRRQGGGRAGRTAACAQGQDRQPGQGDPQARHRIGALVREGLAHPRLRDRGQDRYGPDLELGQGQVEGAALQPQLHRLRGRQEARSTSSPCASRSRCPSASSRARSRCASSRTSCTRWWRARPSTR